MNIARLIMGATKVLNAFLHGHLRPHIWSPVLIAYTADSSIDKLSCSLDSGTLSLDSLLFCLPFSHCSLFPLCLTLLLFFLCVSLIFSSPLSVNTDASPRHPLL